MNGQALVDVTWDEVGPLAQYERRASDDRATSEQLRTSVRRKNDERASGERTTNERATNERASERSNDRAAKRSSMRSAKGSTQRSIERTSKRSSDRPIGLYKNNWAYHGYSGLTQKGFHLVARKRPLGEPRKEPKKFHVFKSCAGSVLGIIF